MALEFKIGIHYLAFSHGYRLGIHNAQHATD